MRDVKGWFGWFVILALFFSVGVGLRAWAVKEAEPRNQEYLNVMENGHDVSLIFNDYDFATHVNNITIDGKEYQYISETPIATTAGKELKGIMLDGSIYDVNMDIAYIGRLYEANNIHITLLTVGLVLTVIASVLTAIFTIGCLFRNFSIATKQECRE